jgi:phosphonate transport system ATP-binding protein
MNAPGSDVIDGRGLQIRAGAQWLLRDVSLRIAVGERVAIVGHNGAGKSTLLRALSGFAPLAGGELRVLDTDMARPAAERLRRLRSQVAQVHQGLHLVARIDALDNVLIGGAARHRSALSWCGHWPRAERHSAADARQRVGMAWAARRRTDALSGGERQKLAIARALHQRAPILLADEPTASLDADAAEEVVGLLSEIADERQATLVCVVHDLELLPRLAERAIVLRHGTVVADVAVTPHTPAQLRGLLR